MCGTTPGFLIYLCSYLLETSPSLASITGPSTVAVSASISLSPLRTLVSPLRLKVCVPPDKVKSFLLLEGSLCPVLPVLWSRVDAGHC